MEYDDISKTPATVGEAVSQRMMQEMFARDDWNIYRSDQNPDLDRHINRFLRSHARIPGIVTEEQLGLVPLAVFRFSGESSPPMTLEGVFYLNGGVVNFYLDYKLRYKYLLVDKQLAAANQYPTNVWTIG